MISAATTRPPKLGEDTGCCEPRGVCALLLVCAALHDEAYCLVEGKARVKCVVKGFLKVHVILLGDLG